MQTVGTDLYPEIREAVRSLCAEFPAEYHRRVDERRAYPEEFVDALTKAGWMAALIPEEYGGSGLGLTEASVIMEEINRSRRQFGRLPRSDVQHEHADAAWLGRADARRYLPKIASGELRLQSMARDRADDRHGHHQDQDHGGAKGRPLRHQRPEGLDQPRPALRSDDPAGAHDADRPGARRSPRALSIFLVDSRKRSARA